MSAILDSQKLGHIFQSRPDIIDGIKRAADSPGRVALFNEIANHVYEQQTNGEPASKRRKVDPLQPATGFNGTQKALPASVLGNARDESVLLQVKEISVSVPQRKKFELCLTQNFIYAQVTGTSTPIPQITYAWQDIEYIFYLPVPDKTQIQHNYVLFPIGTCLPSKTNPPTVEPLVFTVPATAPKEGVIGGSEAASAAAVSDTYRSLFHWAFERRLRAAGNAIDLISADPNKFHSAVRQPQRPNEKAVHVSGFRGSKDGYLFFLENGILWGFKKPLIFIPLNRIAAFSYTNILQITFNIVLETFAGDGEPNEELEFGMLDQQDYGGIDDYVKRNGLQDRSMAEQRKAKLQLAENRGLKKGSDDTNLNGAGDGPTELEKAQLEVEQELQDDEDEDEEDYDPGSEDESDGSGDSSEEDDEDEDDDGEEDDEDEVEEEGVAEEEEEETEVKPEPVSEEPVKPMKPAKPVKPVKTVRSAQSKTKKPLKAEPIQKTVSQVPVRQGWAALGTSRLSGDLDMDEKFEV
ncbi:hypothetical protein QQS21_009668 [Conoideocrella luteorostrata]|uniref:Histone chaperone RTT106/FACT complex subunit SPT16-like middle domain-containing protein n=1 Tax=Conoideocrella luteorostrata TaxID=1105319 RepID=A0AAJ0CKY1_9HYPO|nr:hypothetical protein QQS21_009668 [Conoideocrella luteorostrata]